MRCRLVFNLLLVCSSAGLATAKTEVEPNLAAAELVTPALLAGPHFKVRPYAQYEGLQAHFVIETDWGLLDASSVELLARRVNEMPLVEALHSETMLAALQEAGIGSIRDPFNKAGSIIRSPLRSAARVPAGVLRMLTERVQKLGDRARRIGNRLEVAVFNDGSPTSANPSPSAKQEDPWWDAPVDEVGRLLRSEAGHDRARRDIAKSLGIESWTGNPLLRERLDELAWALASGRMASSKIIAIASAGTSSVIGHIALADRVTSDPPEENQRRVLEERLSQWTADPDLSYQLAWRSAFTPQALSALLDSVDKLQPTSGVEALLDTALLARSEVETQFVLNGLALLLHNGDVPATGGELVAVAQLAGYRATDGEFLLPLAVDRLSWTPEVKRWFDHVSVSEHARRTVLVAGMISPLAERELTRRGWSIRAYVRWPGAPPYQRPGEAA